MPSTTESIQGIITGDVQSNYPISGDLSVSFWVKLDTNHSFSSNKFIVEADDNSNNNIFIIFIKNGCLRVSYFQGAGGGSIETIYSVRLSNETSWNHCVVKINIDDAGDPPPSDRDWETGHP